MEIVDGSASLYRKIFDKDDLSDIESVISHIEELNEDNTLEEIMESYNDSISINRDKMFTPSHIVYAPLNRWDIVDFISCFNERDFVTFSDKDINANSLYLLKPTIKTIVKNMNINLNLKFYIGEINKYIINDSGIIDEIPRYYPKLYRNTKGELFITEDKLLKELLISKGINFKIEQKIEDMLSSTYVPIRDEDIPEELHGIYTLKESNFERMLLNELNKNIKDIKAIEENLEIILNNTGCNMDNRKLSELSIYIKEFIRVLNSCVDEYGNIEDPETYIRVKLYRAPEPTLRNIINFTKKSLIKNKMVSEDILSKSLYAISHISIDDIRTKKDIFMSDYYVVTSDPEKYKHVKDNIYLINNGTDIVITAFSDKYDNIYIPMAGVIHKIETIRDNYTAVVIEYTDGNNIRKRLTINEKNLEKYNIYTSYNKAYENGGQKESLEERQFELKLKEVESKFKTVVLNKVTNERKARLDLISRILKMIEMENDQSAIIRMLEIEKQTLANQNSKIKNAKDGYDFAKRVATDALKYL